MYVWNIQLYQSTLGETPLETFILSLPPTVQQKLLRTFDYVQEFGLDLDYPYLKKVPGTSLWELRIFSVDTILVFYVTVFEHTILLLQGFRRLNSRLNKKEFTIAKRRLKECGVNLYTN